MSVPGQPVDRPNYPRLRVVDASFAVGKLQVCDVGSRYSVFLVPYLMSVPWGLKSATPHISHWLTCAS